MNIRRFAFLTLIGAVCLLLAALWLANPTREVSAQCTGDSSCKTCHETQESFPVNTSGDWHVQHATFDYCVACHGGDREAIDAPAAHVGITTELAAMQTSCATCHTNECDSYLQTYAALLGASINPGAAIPPASGNAQEGLSSFLGAQPAGVDPAALPVTAPETVEPEINRTGNWILVGLIGLVSIGGGGYVTWNERRLLRGRSSGAASASAHAAVDERLAARLSRLSPSAVQALEALLADPALAEQLLPRLIDLDDQTLERLIQANNKKGE